MLTTFLICICWILSVCVHEFGHAIVAYWGGDTSVKDKGYLTFNPLKYIDLNMSLVLPVFFLLMGGIALPGAAVYVQNERLRNTYWRSAVSAAGPLATILLTFLLIIPFWFNLYDLESPIWSAIAFLIVLNICCIFLNLLPIPPLDGYGIIEPWLPGQAQIKFRKFSNYGMIALFMALWFIDPLNRLLWDSTFRVSQIVGVPLDLIYAGQQSLHQSSGILVLIIIGVIVLCKRFINPFEYWRAKGDEFLRTKKYEKTIIAYDKALKIQPNSADTWYYRASALVYLEKYEEAIYCYDKVLEITSDYVDAWYYRAIALDALQRYEEAISCYDKILETEPENPLVWCSRGTAFGYLQRYEEAISSYDKALEIDSTQVNAWYNKACCYAEQNNITLAVEYLQKAISLDPINTIKSAKTDSSFSSIRGEESFQNLMQ